MKNILVVEDDPFCKEFYGMILKRAGYEPLLTDKTEEIERILTEKEFSLIIMDINLKKAMLNGNRVDGLMVTKYLKNDQRFSHIPIILVTAYSKILVTKDVLTDSMADALITKPIIDINQFISQLENVMIEQI